MPTTTSKILSLHCLRRRAAGGGGDGHPEKDIQPPRKKLEATLLEDVQIRQE